MSAAEASPGSPDGSGIDGIDGSSKLGARDGAVGREAPEAEEAVVGGVGVDTAVTGAGVAGAGVAGAGVAGAGVESGCSSGVDRDSTCPGTTVGPPPRRRTTVVLCTPGNLNEGIFGASGGSIPAGPLAATGRRLPADAGLETFRRTASGAGRLDVGGAGRWLERGFAVILRGRGTGGKAVAVGSSSAVASSSRGVIRCSSSGAEGRSRRLARLFTRPEIFTSTACVNSVSATARGRRVTR